MKTLGEVLQLTLQCFKDKNIERPRRIAEEILSHVLNLPRMDLYMKFDKPLIEKELEILRELVKRKLRGEPLDYILGRVRFYDCEIALTRDVLIPRPETEVLLDRACGILKNKELAGKAAWDLCTGSGCIGIALKKKFSELAVALSDISAKALAVARGNAERNQVDVECLEGDLCAPFSKRKADVIFCNPPYISKNEFEHLDMSVRAFEPQEALIGGEDGLDFYKRLSRDLPKFLNSGALIFLEIGASQGKRVQEIFSEPHWLKKTLEKDWAGHDRFFFLEFE